MVIIMSKQKLIDASTLFGPDGRFATSGCVGYCEACPHWSEEGCRVILDAPTVDAVPVAHGRWKDRFNGKIDTPTPVYECSVCGKPALYKHCFELDLRCTMHQVRYLSPYCPNCGAKMDGEKHD